MNLPQLSITRFVAILLIIIWHFGRTIPPFTGPVIGQFIADAPWAVSYFFLLSGFIMVIAYGGDDDRKPFDRKRYWFARLVRLYPVYLLSVVLFLVPFLIDKSAVIRTVPLVLNLMLVQAWVPPFPVYMNGPAWALSVLVFFYLLFPFLLPLMKRMSRARLISFMAIIWAVSLAVHIALLETVYPGGPSLAHDIIFYNPLLHVNSFVCGMGGGLLLLQMPERSERRLPLIMIASAAAALSLIVLVPNPVSKYCHNGLLSPVWMLAIIGLSLDRSALSRVLSSRPLVLLGEVSFGMYILQRAIYGFAVILFARYPVTRDPTAQFLVYLAALFLVSWASYAWIEMPARRAFRRWYADRRGKGDIS